ncbi:Uncharacterised protein [Serratia plymuthica]|nr:Uncharacterised protein [Serratia plymuthica]
MPRLMCGVIELANATPPVVAGLLVIALVLLAVLAVTLANAAGRRRG